MDSPGQCTVEHSDDPSLGDQAVQVQYCTVPRQCKVIHCDKVSLGDQALQVLGSCFLGPIHLEVVSSLKDLGVSGRKEQVQEIMPPHTQTQGPAPAPSHSVDEARSQTRL